MRGAFAGTPLLLLALCAGALVWPGPEATAVPPAAAAFVVTGGGPALTTPPAKPQSHHMRPELANAIANWCQYYIKQCPGAHSDDCDHGERPMSKLSGFADAILFVDVDSYQCVYSQPSVQFDMRPCKLLPALGDAPLL